ncbi:MAG TPA: sulfatase [Planctomycetota bacterium]|nr:sulfatase [Planctomycetota bacterium]
MRQLLAIVVTALLLAPVQAGERQNVIFILIDDLGWSDLSCTGSDFYKTPNIDRLAAGGMKFTNAYSACTVCSPTRASFLTGKYPARLRITDWIPGHNRPKARLKVPEWTQALPNDEITVAEVLKASGYATGHIGKWHLGKDNGPELHGFDFTLAGTHMGQPPSFFSPYKLPTLSNGPDGEYLTDREGDEACRFIEAHRDKPFFLYLPHHCVHTPIQAKKPLIEQYKAVSKPGARHSNATYAAMIHSLDESIGKILAKLEELKIAERTTIIFTSDNGGLMGVTSNAPLRVGKGSAYEGGVRVPLIVKSPGITPAGSVCEQVVITPDFFPTAIELSGARVDAKLAPVLDGTSLLPAMRDPKQGLNRDAVYWHYPHYHPGGATPYSALRAGNWKLIEFFEDNHIELYDLGNDVSESKNLADTMPEKAAELRKQLHAWRERVQAQLPSPNPDYDPHEAQGSRKAKKQ